MSKYWLLYVLFSVVIFGSYLHEISAFDSDVQIDSNFSNNELNIQNFANTHLPFVENQGQVDDKVKYYVDTFAGRVFVTDNQLRYSIAANNDESMNVYVFDEKFLDSNFLNPIGKTKSNSVVNYFFGNSEWNQNVSTFDSVFMQNVWDSIDVNLNAYGNNVEKIFLIHPQGDPALIKMGFDGIDRLLVNENGELEITIGNEIIFMTSPIAYQYIDGKKKNIDVSYTTQGNEYGFVVKNYDPNYLLIIDPLLASTFLGTIENESNRNLVIDSSGSVFVVGSATSTNFPTTVGAYSNTISSTDVYISKFSSDLTTLQASTFLGGSDPDIGRDIAIDSNEDIFILADTQSANFPTTSGAFAQTRSGNQEGAISKLSNDLTSLISSTYIGGTGTESFGRINIDSSGNVLIGGRTNSVDYPTTPSAFSASRTSGLDLVVSKLSNDLSALQASTYIGGSLDEFSISKILTDASGNVFISGWTRSADFPVTAGAYDETFNLITESFISKFDNNLSTLQSSTFIGGTNGDSSGGMVLDTFGNVFVTGTTSSSDFPVTAGAYDETFNGGTDVYISKFTNNLSTLQASTLLGGNMNDGPLTITTDSSGNVFVAGIVNSEDFPATPGAFDETYGGNTDGFISKFNNDLTVLLASTYFGGGGETAPTSIAQGDFNGDTMQDLVTTNGGGFNTVSILLGNGDGTFGPATSFAVGANPSSVTIGYFDGDEIQDLAISNMDSNNVSILLGNGDGTFGPATSFAVGVNPRSIITGDFNGDTRYDLATANMASNDVSILLGNGDGTFGPATSFAVSPRPSSITIGDFNNDAIQDLAISNRFGSNDVSILLGNGDGAFGPATSFAVGASPWSLTVGYFNGDTIQDIAVSNAGSKSISILLGNGDGTFGPATSFAVGATPSSINVGDFNNDAIQDLVITNQSPSNMSIFLGNGDGTFETPIISDSGRNPAHIVVGDFNGDAIQDLATGTGGSSIAVFLGNGDGIFGEKILYGGNGTDEILGIAIDLAGNIVVVGTTLASDFPSTSGAYDETYNDSFDGFISKITSDLSATAPDINNFPTAQDDEYLVTQNTSLVLNSQNGVLANDSDADGDMLFATIQTATSNGVISLNPDGSFSYQPNSGFLGTDTFTYVADDGNDGTATATVTFIVRSPTSVGTLIVCEENDPTSDNDFDSICDGWEDSNGLVINELDFESLAIPFTFPSPDITCVSNFDCLPDPNIKDIYVEVDWMSGQAPDQSAIQDVVDAFANKGIRLHVLLDEDIGIQLEQTSVDFTDTDFTDPTGFVALKQNYFGTTQERQDTLTEPKILEAKRQIFHYGLFIHEQKNKIGSSGFGEVEGNDFVVSLGSFGNGVGTPAEQSGTFMHELGHNLGLHHGGPKTANTMEDNCKPNYLSVMSYSLQFPSYLSARPLDYSHSVLASLDEASLDEADGVQASTPPNLRTVYGPPAYRESVTGIGIDWNGVGGISGTATNVNINDLGFVGCTSETISILTGHNDWNSLTFDFRVRPNFDSGLTFYHSPDQELTAQAVNQIQESVTTHQITVFDSIPDSALIDPETRQAFEDSIYEILALVQADDFDNAILRIDSLVALVPTMINDQNELDKLLDSLNNWSGTLVLSGEEPIQLVTKTSQQQIQQLITKLQNPIEPPQSKQISDEISKATDNLLTSIEDKFWNDSNTLDSQHGHEAIHFQEKAAKSLMNIANDSEGAESDIMTSYIEEIIEQITQIDRKLAQSAIIVAQANAVNNNNILSAQDEMAQGDNAASEGKFDEAIHHYEKAWKGVQ